MDLIAITLFLPIVAIRFWLKMRRRRWDRRMLWSLLGGALLGAGITFPGLYRPLPCPTVLPSPVISIAVTAIYSLALAPTFWLSLRLLHRIRAERRARIQQAKQRNHEGEAGATATECRSR